MGIADFLTRVLESAGRPCDLKSYAEGIAEKVEGSKRRRRPLRLGIDVSSWIYNAAHGFGEMLGDERHLTNYGRAALYDEQQQQQQDDPEGALSSLNPSEEKIQEYVEKCTKYVLSRMQLLRDMTKADILVVLDGASPPIKTREVERRRELRREQERLRDQPVDPNESPTKSNERRTKAFRRAGAGRYHTRIVDQLLKGLRQAQIAFVVAPYEADSELAYLADTGYIDLVVTEDSDLVAHGAKAILYKSVAEISNNNPRGKLLKFSDIGAIQGENWNLADFTPVMMTILFVAVGCDYCDKLKGVGLLTASRVIREAFCSPVNPFYYGRFGSPSKLSKVFEQLYVRCYLDSTTLTPQFKREYEERFLAAIFMYRHPIVYDPIQENNFLMSRCLYSSEREEPNDGDVSEASSVQYGSNPMKLYIDKDLLDHDPYVELCEDFERIQEIVGKLQSKEEAMKAAQGLKVDSSENTTISSEHANEANGTKHSDQEDVVPQDQPEESGETQQDDSSMAPEESQMLATQDVVIEENDNDKENSESLTPSKPAEEESESSNEDEDAGKETTAQGGMSDEEFLDTQQFTSPVAKPSSRPLENEVRAGENGTGISPATSKSSSPITEAMPKPKSPVPRVTTSTAKGGDQENDVYYDC